MATNSIECLAALHEGHSGITLVTVQQPVCETTLLRSDKSRTLFYLLKIGGEFTSQYSIDRRSHQIIYSTLTTACVSNSLQKHGPPAGIQ
jgi:hypothetical protein